KGALFSASDDIESKFKTLPMTFGDVANSFKNTLQLGSQGVLNQLGALADSPAMKNIANSLLSFTGKGIAAMGWLGNHINGVSTALKTGLIIWVSYKAGIFAVIAANTAYSASAAIAAIQTHGFKAALLGQAAAIGSTVIPTTTATGAVRGLNAAMIANPIGLVVMAIGTLIGTLGLLSTSYRNSAKAANAAASASANFLMISGISETNLSIDKKIDALTKKTKSNTINTAHGALRDTKSYRSIKDTKTKKNNMISWMEESKDTEFNDMMSYLKTGKGSSEIKRKYYNSWGLGSGDKSEMLSIMKKAKTGRMLNNMDAFNIDDYEIPTMNDRSIDTVNDVGTVDKVNGEVNIADESLKYLVDGIIRGNINNINLKTTQPNFKIEFSGDITETADSEKIAKQIIEKAKEKLYSGTDLSYDF
ncbi:MAG: hypothetical protein RR233_08790, partial [Clostridiales bacterium]